MKDEKLITVIVCLIFTFAGIFGLVWGFPSIAYMAANDPGFAIIGFLSAAVCLYAWVRVLRGFGDPNQDHWRWICILSAIAVSAIFGAYHAQHKIDKEEGIVKVSNDLPARSHTHWI